MHKHRSLIFSLLTFTVVISTGFCCIKYLIGGHAEEGTASMEMHVVNFGFTGLVALLLSTLTYSCLTKSWKLRIHAKELTESNRRLEEEIIQRKAAEEKSANLAREWAKTFDSIPDLISIHSNDFRIVRVNQALADSLGMEKEDIIGKFCYEVFHGTEGPVPECPHVRTMETKKPVTVEFCNLRTTAHSMVSTSPIFNRQYEMVGTVHIVKDTTEMKNLEERLRHAQKMEAVGQLAGGVAHDFNNILAAIINYGYLLKDQLPGDIEQRDFTEKILTLAKKAASTTQGLLTYSRKQSFELKLRNLNAILKNIKQLLLNFTGGDIELVQLLSEDELMILADENRIEQCVVNLATNARDAMPSGGRLTIKTELVEIDSGFIQAHGFGASGSYALISVEDTGVGMSAETRQKIFEPFFTTKEVGKGTGLGLAMVYGITKQHKGYIDVCSKPGQGTTFKLYFPLIKEYDETKKSVLPAKEESQGIPALRPE